MAIPGSSAQLSVDGRTTRTRDYVAGPVLYGPKGDQGVAGADGATGAQGPPGGIEGASAAAHGCVADGVTDDTAALNATIAADSNLVYVGPGTYRVSGAFASAVAGQTIQFAPGAELLVDPDTGSVSFTGARQRVDGLVVRVATASSATRVLCKFSGANMSSGRTALNVDADVPNATILKVEGDESLIGHVDVVTAGFAFKYGVDLTAAAGAHVNNVIVSGLNASMGSPASDKTYGALLNMTSNSSAVYDLTIRNCGGHTLFPDGVVILREASNRNAFYNPQITLITGAKYAIYREFAAEFLTIEGGNLQGRNNGTYYSGSEGIYSGHAAGHLKCKDLAVSGWQYAEGIHGTHDTPVFEGCVFANNDLGAHLIDSKIGSDVWPVSGFTLLGCYGEAQATGSTQVYIHAVTGTIKGGSVTGCYIGVDTHFLQCESGMGPVGLDVRGNRFAGVAGQALFAVNATDTIGWSRTNDLFQITVLANDLTRIFSDTDTTLDGLQVGASGAHYTSFISDVYTANFGNIGAGVTVALAFAYAAVPTVTTAEMTATMGGALGVFCQSGIIFQWYINIAGQIVGTATNITGSPINSVTGGVRFTVTVFG